ncbi:hypothetical protein OGAPHI_002682 [Ogataea philodendri]|uniref:Uncharacterized protein n=1 Tax=Ogataea philodendri TaxID=1378263 RepID=A0A9P8PBG0_9ASCO|nr:uncharacterized protein OGAPHI_002682 [Ogataea philodendri]KAH3668927.1 hypothetical protein OGAPHI_002682 [Ogataea philodendri]
MLITFGLRHSSFPLALHWTANRSNRCRGMSTYSLNSPFSPMARNLPFGSRLRFHSGLNSHAFNLGINGTFHATGGSPYWRRESRLVSKTVRVCCWRSATISLSPKITLLPMRLRFTVSWYVSASCPSSSPEYSNVNTESFAVTTCHQKLVVLVYVQNAVFGGENLVFWGDLHVVRTHKVRAFIADTSLAFQPHLARVEPVLIENIVKRSNKQQKLVVQLDQFYHCGLEIVDSRVDQHIVSKDSKSLQVHLLRNIFVFKSANSWISPVSSSLENAMCLDSYQLVSTKCCLSSNSNRKICVMSLYFSSGTDFSALWPQCMLNREPRESHRPTAQSSCVEVGLTNLDRCDGTIA